MKVIDSINNSDKTVFSFELLPPLKGNDASKIYRTIESLVDFDPKYINITTHRDEMEFKELEDLPNTTNPDDWAKIAGQKGEKIIHVRTLTEDSSESRKIETVSVGHYF